MKAAIITVTGVVLAAMAFGNALLSGDLREQNQTLTETCVEQEAMLQDLRADNEFYAGYLTRTFGVEVQRGALRTTQVRVTVYNPVKEQCDSDPLTAADNKRVMPGIVAMPKAYREKLGLRVGQVITLHRLGAFLVRDHMSSRFGDEARVDVISFIKDWHINEVRTMTWVAGG